MLDLFSVTMKIIIEWCQKDDAGTWNRALSHAFADFEPLHKLVECKQIQHTKAIYSFRTFSTNAHTFVSLPWDVATVLI